MAPPVFAYAQMTRRPANEPLAFHEQMLLTAIMNGVLLVAVPLVLRWTSGARLGHLGLSWHRLGRQARAGALAFLLVALPVYMVNVVLRLVWKPRKHPLEMMMMLEKGAGLPMSQLALLAFLTAVVFAPAAEELMFRGVLQNWLERLFQRRGRVQELPSVAPEDLPCADRTIDVPPQPHVWTDNPYEAPEAPLTPLAVWEEDQAPPPRAASLWPVVLTSALFGLVHYAQWPAPIPIFVLSLALGVVYQRTRSLVASFVLHALFNGLSTVLLFQVMLSGNLPGKVNNVVPPEARVTPAAPSPAPVPKIWR